MDREELYRLLDIEYGSQFEYFENFADFVEHDGVIDGDAVSELMGEIDLKTFAELCESYFYDILENVPGDQIDIYNLLETIKRVLVGLSEAAGGDDEENALLRLADEFNRFRIWYSIESRVECRDPDTGRVQFMSVRDALANARLEKISGGESFYDFQDAMDYELEEYIMTYADLVSE